MIRSLTLGLRHQAEALERALVLHPHGHQLDHLYHSAVRLKAEADLAIAGALAIPSRNLTRELGELLNPSARP